MDNDRIWPKWTTALLLGLAGIGCVVAVRGASATGVGVIATLWLLGAAGLGLVTGYSTGASKTGGALAEFLTFLSGGVLVPLFGAAASLTQSTERVVESFRHEDGELIEHITETVHMLPDGYLHPIAVLGGFLAVYSALAVLGILIGIHHRSTGVTIELGAS